MQLLLVLVCFLLGYLSASVFDFTSLSSWVNTKVLAKRTWTAATKAPVQQAQLPKPKFEFYTLLANEHPEAKTSLATSVQANAPTKALPSSAPQPMQLALSAPVAKQSNLVNLPPPKITPPLQQSPPHVVLAKPVPALGTSTNRGSYLVQVGAFRNNQEAQRMKAALVLKGFIVNVTVINQQNTNWYRVSMGPFASRPLALKAQMAVARSEHIVGMIRKMDA